MLNTNNFLKFSLRRNLYFIVLTISVLSYQNCTYNNNNLNLVQSLFKSTTENNSPLHVSSISTENESLEGGASGNGSGYEGKPTQEWVRIIPDLVCPKANYLSKISIFKENVRLSTTDSATCDENIIEINLKDLAISEKQTDVIGYKDGIFLKQHNTTYNQKYSSLIWCTGNDETEILINSNLDNNFQEKNISNLNAIFWIDSNSDEMKPFVPHVKKKMIMISDNKTKLNIDKQIFTIDSFDSIRNQNLKLTIDASIPLLQNPKQSDKLYLGKLNVLASEAGHTNTKSMISKPVSCRLGYQFDGYRWPSQIAKSIKVRLASYNAKTDHLWILGAEHSFNENIFSYDLNSNSATPILQQNNSNNYSIHNFIDLDNQLLINEISNGFKLLQYRYSKLDPAHGQFTYLENSNVLFDVSTMDPEVDFTSTYSAWLLKKHLGMSSNSDSENIFYSSTDFRKSIKWNTFESFKRFNLQNGKSFALTSTTHSEKLKFTFDPKTYIYTIKHMNLSNTAIIQANVNCEYQYICSYIDFFLISFDNGNQILPLNISKILSQKFNNSFQILSEHPIISPKDTWLLFSTKNNTTNETQWFKFNLANFNLDKIDINFQPNLSIPPLKENSNNLMTYDWIDEDHLIHNRWIFSLSTNYKIGTDLLLNYQLLESDYEKKSFSSTEKDRIILLNGISEKHSEIIIYNLSSDQIISHYNIDSNFSETTVVDFLGKQLNISNEEFTYLLFPQSRNNLAFPVLRHFSNSKLVQLCELKVNSNYKPALTCRNKFLIYSYEISKMKTIGDKIYFLSKTSKNDQNSLYMTSLNDGQTMMINDRSDMFGGVTNYFVRHNNNIYFQSYIYSLAQDTYTYLFQWSP